MTKEPLYYGSMDSPFGPLTIARTSEGVCRIMFGSIEESNSTLKIWMKKYLQKDELIFDETTLIPVYEQLTDYFNEERQTFDFELDMYGTPFQLKVWEALQEIPYGETYSYKDVAQAIHAPKAVRAVGCAVNKNPLPIVIPCHRVIGSNGSLVGYNGGLDKKETLLGIEHALEHVML
ncbi:methylated-DNA--[protein]-cysteine S-methyltransferase [Bacillus tianshenii]|nr:methylated-DNA--[protein]-cysteine S-methyltransferase [Bacillus tianshenii]